MLTPGAQYKRHVLHSGAAGLAEGLALTCTDGSGGVYAVLTCQIVGMGTATITWEGTIDEITWAAVPGFSLATQEAATTATANGLYRIPVTGLVQVRARISAYTSGAIYVYGLMSSAGESGVRAGGSGGISDHALLSNLDFASSGHTGFEAAGAGAAAVVTHVGLADPHTQYLLESAYTLLDTRVNILASSPATKQLAFATDTLEMFYWTGSAWYVAPLELIQQANAVDMGLQPPMAVNDRAGYSADYITDKAIYNSRILGNANSTEGSIRTSSGVLQAYLNGTWADVVTGFRFREDSAGYYELEHKPVGFTWWLEVMSGNSDDLGLNGLPLAQQYRVSMGAYPVHEQIVGRSITA